jgi:UDP-N-acetylmuramoyl-L-alanyl-D-glutamate--2,6-diaminopimelate ligase
MVTFSTEGKKADINAEDISFYSDRTEFIIKSSLEDQPITLKLPGRYNLSNALGAAAVGIASGIELPIVAAGLEKSDPIPGRFQPVNCGQPFSVIIDYAHTPDALSRLCQSAQDITDNKLLILFGCGGDRDQGKRPLMGKAASENSDFCVVTSDNPRTEDPERIIEDVLPGMTSDNYSIKCDRSEAIDEIINRAEKGDTVLIAGKGAEDYQEIGTVRYPYEDKQEIIRALKNLGYKDCQG